MGRAGTKRAGQPASRARRRPLPAWDALPIRHVQSRSGQGHSPFLAIVVSTQGNTHLTRRRVEHHFAPCRHFGPQSIGVQHLRHRLAIRRCLNNLVDNALRHAGEDKPVELSCVMTGQEACIDVSDRGPGIPPEQIERLKRPFTRLDNSRTGQSGAGLGLAIVERTLRAHGGRFELLARDGGGLIARLRLPISTPAATLRDKKAGSVKAG